MRKKYKAPAPPDSLLMMSLLSLLATTTQAQYTVNDRQVGVQLFQWPFASIAQECVDFLGPNGYSFVQTSPVQEHAKNSFDGYNNPWYLVYQPLGYKIGNRLGSVADFKNMTHVCKSVGVDIVVDVVLNHFAYVNEKDNGGYGTSGAWDSHAFHENFPDAGYNSTHFHDSKCNGPINWNDLQSIYNCQLSTLVDVDTANSFVQQSVANFLNKLVDYGVAGFRFDAAKAMPAADIAGFLSTLKKNYRGLKPYVTQEIYNPFPNGQIDQPLANTAAPAYSTNGRILSFEYGPAVGRVFRQISGTTNQLQSILSSLQVGSAHSTVFIENHDLERNTDGDGSWALSRKNDAQYKQAMAFNILYPWGLPQVHSGYSIQYNGGGSIRESPVSAPFDSFGKIKAVAPIVGNICPQGWACQHRWSDIFPLVRVRNLIGKNQTPQIQGLGTNQIYWSVAGKAFAAINSASNAMSGTVHTGLAPGQYCNMVYGYAGNGQCNLWPGVVLANGEALVYTVDKNGNTNLSINVNDKSQVVALYSGPDGFFGSSPTTSVPVVTSTPVPTTTVTFKVTHDAGLGDQLFVVGSFNNWNTCSGIPLTWTAGNIWTSSSVPLVSGNVYQWKTISYGTHTQTTCSTPNWQGGNNNIFTASNNLVVSAAY
ncbi:hypothetical protein HDV06_001473 [Boothiomyces sp. JEL0866]|nr:hypothetical protein HDV06_001473 [Boothiomyces sp. JEL0866]